MNRRTNRRELLKNAALAGTGLWLANTGAIAEDDAPKEKRTMELKPHHLIDIVRGHGKGRKFDEPAACGHAQHIVAPAVLSDLELKVKFIVGPDDICKPCKFLLPDGACKRFPKYNDVLDDALFRHLGLAPGAVMTARQFLETVDKKLPGMEEANE